MSDPTKAVGVEVSLSILRILDFDEDTNVVTILGFLAMVGIKLAHIALAFSGGQSVASYTSGLEPR